MKQFFALCCVILLLFSYEARAVDVNLNLYERSLFSQYGEDGILAKFFHVLKPKTMFCVELGAGDGVKRNATYILRRLGWQGILLDRSNEDAENRLFKGFITAENVNDYLHKYAVPKEFDLLNINLGYNDFYIWKALDTSYKPTLVVINYNSLHAPSEDKVCKYLPFYCGDDTDYYGASILAMYNLGRSKGYSLIYSDQSGNKLFFVRDDILAESDVRFIQTNKVEKLYRDPALMGAPVRKKDPKNRPYVSSSELLRS